jgi:hypothetical protein
MIRHTKSAYDAFIMSATAPPERHNPKAWTNYGCKDSEIFWIEQIFCLKSYVSLIGKDNESPNSIRENGHRKAQSAIWRHGAKSR